MAGGVTLTQAPGAHDPASMHGSGTGGPESAPPALDEVAVFDVLEDSVGPVDTELLVLALVVVAAMFPPPPVVLPPASVETSVGSLDPPQPAAVAREGAATARTTRRVRGDLRRGNWVQARKLVFIVGDTASRVPHAPRDRKQRAIGSEVPFVEREPRVKGLNIAELRVQSSSPAFGVLSRHGHLPSRDDELRPVRISRTMAPISPIQRERACRTR